MKVRNDSSAKVRAVDHGVVLDPGETATVTAAAGAALVAAEGVTEVAAPRKRKAKSDG